MEFFGIITINPETFNVWSLRISMSLTTTIFLIACFMALRAFLHTKGADPAYLDRVKGKEMTPGDSLSVRVAKMLWSTARGGSKRRAGHTGPVPAGRHAAGGREFLRRQIREPHLHVRQPPPPIGLWGTVAGMIVIFLYTGDPASA